MQRACAIGAERAVPAVAIPGNPGVSLGGQPTDARDQKKPREKLPAGKKQPDSGPSFRAGPYAAVSVNRLHPTHGCLAVNLGESLLCRRVVEVEELDALATIERAHALNARPAEAAGPIVENGKLGHVISLRSCPLHLILYLSRVSQSGGRKEPRPRNTPAPGLLPVLR